MASLSAASLDKFITQNRYAVLAGCSLIAYVWAASEGRPLKFLAKHLFRGALALVPRSMVAQEKLKLRDKIEASTIGDSLDGEALYLELPQEGARAGAERRARARARGRTHLSATHGISAQAAP